jgi:CubicO group peptidase (beta-lactamase class C family)
MHNTRWSCAERYPDEAADGEFAPMGGLWSTAADLMRWVWFLMDAFPARNGPDSSVLRRSSRREMQQVRSSTTTHSQAL